MTAEQAAIKAAYKKAETDALRQHRAVLTGILAMPLAPDATWKDVAEIQKLADKLHKIVLS